MLSRDQSILPGWKVKDRVMGVEGIIWGRTEFLNGCVHLTVRPLTFVSQLQPIDSTIELEEKAFEKIGDEPEFPFAMPPWRIELGDYCEDAITGLSGICWSRTAWLFGNMRITIAPVKLAKDKSIPESVVFDHGQVKLTPRKKNILLSLPGYNEPPGGPSREPKQRGAARGR